MGPQALLISISLAVRQTPAYAVRLETWASVLCGHCDMLVLLVVIVPIHMKGWHLRLS